VSIGLSTRWQTRKKEGKSVQGKLVGVRGYGRDCLGRKQAKSPENYGFQGFSQYLFLTNSRSFNWLSKIANPYKHLKNSSLLAVDRLFRQSESCDILSQLLMLP